MDFKITPYYYIQYIETLVERRKSKRGWIQPTQLTSYNSCHCNASAKSSAVEEPEQFSSLVPFVLVVFFVYNLLLLEEHGDVFELS